MWLAAVSLAAIIVPLEAHEGARYMPVSLAAMSALQTATQGSAAVGRQLSGTWQGTLQVSRGPLRIVMRISSDADELRVVMHSIDDSPDGFAASSVTVQGASVRLVFPAFRGSFEGTLNSAVATIRPSRPGDERPPLIQIQNRRWFAINRTVMELITYGYSLHPGQVVNAPGWIQEQYDITALPDGEGQPATGQWQMMVRTLLVDRFKLSAHVDNKRMSVYALTVKDAPRSMAPSTGDSAGPANRQKIENTRY
jgi:hypothetical protein